MEQKPAALLTFSEHLLELEKRNTLTVHEVKIVTTLLLGDWEIWSSGLSWLTAESCNVAS